MYGALVVAALGFSAHTGWAVMVAVGGRPPHVIARSRIALASPGKTTEQLQAYHLAEQLPIAKARTGVTRARRAAEEAAHASLRSELAALGHAVARAAIVGGNSTIPDDLEAILASHALIHAAEGALFRDAIAAALARLDVTAVEIPSNQLVDDRLVARLGKHLGAPWARDHKLAALAACIALDARRG